jgi:hypothetical protein
LFHRLAGFPVFYSSSESGSAATYRKIINWRETLEEALDEVSMSEEARDLVRRFLCERTVRIGAHGGLEEIQAHPFFDGFDWDRVRDGPAPLVPHIAHATDTSNFPMEDMDGEQFGAEEVEDAEIEERYPLYRHALFFVHDYLCCAYIHLGTSFWQRTTASSNRYSIHWLHVQKSCCRSSAHSIPVKKEVSL